MATLDVGHQLHCLQDRGVIRSTRRPSNRLLPEIAMLFSSDMNIISQEPLTYDRAWSPQYSPKYFIRVTTMISTSMGLLTWDFGQVVMQACSLTRQL